MKSVVYVGIMDKICMKVVIVCTELVTVVGKIGSARN